MGMAFNLICAYVIGRKGFLVIGLIQKYHFDQYASNVYYMHHPYSLVCLWGVWYRIYTNLSMACVWCE